MNQKYIALIVVAVCNLFTSGNPAFAQGTAFTYQGQLSANGNPASGHYDLAFALFNTNSTNPGQQIGDTLTNLDVGVTNGLFIATLDFGDNFPGASRWLAIGVRTNGAAGFTALNPLQEVTPTPYAIYTANAGSAAAATSANNVAVGIDITNGVLINSIFGGNGGGLTNLNASQLTGSATINNLTLNGALTLPDIYQGDSSVIYSGSSLLLYADDAANFFIGPGAGNVATTDDGSYQNTAVGEGALYNNTSGYLNTAIGVDALYNNTGGYNNTAVGLGALSDNTGGSGNTANGFLALGNNTSGYNNTALGLSALNYNGTGNNNTAIGPDALYKLGALTGSPPGFPPFGGGTNNIALGYQAGYNFTENESGNIDIGNLGVAGENNIIRIGTPGVQTNTVIAGVINGNGAGLTNLIAANIAPGGTLPALNGATFNNLTLNGALTLPDIYQGDSSVIYSGSSLLLYADDAANFFIGPGAGNVATTDDGSYQNTAVGEGALYNNTSGYLNTAIGVDALYNNTGGYNNTAVGLGALSDNTGGSGNTANGFLALGNNTSGYNNTALGLSALNYNGTGNNNTAIGPDALYKLGALTGSPPGFPPFGGGTNNIALGYQAGYNFTENESGNIDIGSLGVAGENNVIRIGSNQVTAYIAGVITGNGGGLTNLPSANLTGTLPALNGANLTNLSVNTSELSSYGNSNSGQGGNFFVGNNAGNATTSGSANIALGNEALWQNTTGSDNTAIGDFALEFNMSGTGNTALGFYALNFNGSGSNNIALGYDAGLYISSGSSNIDIGNPGVSTDANIIRIGSNQVTAYIAGVITGNGGGLTNLPSANLTGTLPALNGANLTNLSVNTSELSSYGNSNSGQGGNFFVGNNAGNATTSGSANIALGNEALWQNTTGSDNTAIGDFALEFNMSGTGNTALGFYALNFNGSGSNNIALGYDAGLYISSGSSNIDIGNPGVSTDANIIRIGTNQVTAYIAGTITGDGGGLTNLTLNNASDSTVASGLNNSVSGSTDSVIGGGTNNVLTNVAGSAIVGGLSNTNNASQSTVGGGTGNFIEIGAYYAFLGSGGGNVIGTNSDTAFLGAGYHNLIGINAAATVLGGGQYNAISNSATFSVLGGGYQNTNTGPYSVIPGGENNVAASYSFAAGSNALATNNSAFVWSDGSAATGSTNTNSVTLRASGGYRLFTSSGASGAFLGANQASWSTISDRNAKKNFQPVNTKAVLDKLASIPIQQWNYKWEKDGDVPNIGPMAQDFKAAFYPGRDDKSITTLEFDGVELAAIQGLNQKLKEKDAQIEALQDKAAQVDTLEKRLNELEETVQLLVAKK